MVAQQFGLKIGGTANLTRCWNIQRQWFLFKIRQLYRNFGIFCWKNACETEVVVNGTVLKLLMEERNI